MSTVARGRHAVLRRVARTVLEFQAERRAFFQHRAGGDLADAQFGSLEVDQDADRAPELSFDRADTRVHRTHIVMAAVAHVQTERIRARSKQRADHIFR